MKRQLGALADEGGGLSRLWDEQHDQQVVRLTLGHPTTREEIDRAVEILARAWRRLVAQSSSSSSRP